MDDKIWINKKVYLRIADRSYSGRVILEDEFSITIIDIYSHHVRFLKKDISLMQEEKQ
jgi:hypothetical protein